jgi:MFS family permease
VIPKFDLSGLRQARWSPYAARFVLGGVVTVCTGLIADKWGLIIGGLFLCFPAIFPASATLIERHQTEKKARMGLSGRRRGRQAAALDAAGAVWGAVGLAAFGATAWKLFDLRPPMWALSAAALVWLGVAVCLWWLRFRFLARHRKVTPPHRINGPADAKLTVTAKAPRRGSS